MRTDDTIANTVLWRSDLPGKNRYGFGFQTNITNISSITWSVVLRRLSIQISDYSEVVLESPQRRVEARVRSHKDAVESACGGSQHLLKLFETVAGEPSLLNTNYPVINIPDYYLMDAERELSRVPFGTCIQTAGRVQCNPDSFGLCVTGLRAAMSPKVTVGYTVDAVHTNLPMTKMVEQGHTILTLPVEVDVDKDNSTLLRWQQACTLGTVDMVKLLVNLEGLGKRSELLPFYQFPIAAQLENYVSCTSLGLS